MLKTITHTTLINCLSTNPIINPTVNDIILHDYNSEDSISKRTETTLCHSSDRSSDSICLINNMVSVNDSGYKSMESLYFDASSDFLDNSSSLIESYTQSTDFEYLNPDEYLNRDTENIIRAPNGINFRGFMKNSIPIKHTFSFTHNYSENMLTLQERLSNVKKNLVKFIGDAKIGIKKFKKASRKQKLDGN